MSFDFNPMQNLSNVQASAKSCAGGGGNTGYFKRGKAEDEKDESLEFSKDDSSGDSFEREDALDEIQQDSLWTIIKNLFCDFLESIKNFFSK